jgi:hypothetical protein
MGLDHPQRIRAAELAQQGQPVDVERVHREHVVMKDRVVPRRAGTIVAVVVAGHVGIAGEPAGVVVDALPRTWAAAGPDLPRAVTPSLNSPSPISCTAAGRSTSTQ